MSPNPHIAFLGGGNMATAIISGMIKHDFSTNQVSVIELNEDNRKYLSDQWGVHTFNSLAQYNASPDVWVLAVKPQNMHDALQELTPKLSPTQLIISVAAGLTVETLSNWTQKHPKIARTMPNTPALVGQGVTGIYAPRNPFNEAEQGLIDRLFKAVGSTIWLETESAIDAITAISGSGPAYVFYMMEHLTHAAIALGFDETTAQMLVKQTFAGAVTLANNSTNSLSTLREKVTSKGGTTAAAIDTFNQHNIDKGLIAGAKAATARAQELATELAK